MSIRNIDADLAASKLNELFHLHRYDDCVLFINRLSPTALIHLLPNLPIDAYLSRLPYTIELFESLYAKVFIFDPDQFPARTLQPERLIDKMVAYFSLLHLSSNVDCTDIDPSVFLEPVDGAKMLDSFENVIRVISYVQPQQYSRLLYFKYAIDRALLRFDRDLVSFSRNLAALNEYLLVNQAVSSSFHKSGMKKSKSIGNIYANALLISRASNLQTCEAMRAELEKSISSCQKAHLRLNDYISHLKAQKTSKNLQSIVFGNGSGGSREISPPPTPCKSSTPKKDAKKERKASASTERSNEAKSSKKSTPRSESVSNFRQQQQPTHSVSSIGSPSTTQDALSATNYQPTSATLPNMKRNTSSPVIGTATICQDFIQNRLYLNKAMMNSVEPFLESIKLQQLLNSLYEKIDLDKEILLVYTHIKREEPYLSSLEPLQPLFKRYSLGFERCIQIWRKKCSADSLLVCNSFDPALALPDPNLNNSTAATQKPTIEHNESAYSISNKLNISASPSIAQLDVHNNQQQLAAAAALSTATALASSAIPNATPSKTTVVNSNISINYSTANVGGNTAEAAEASTPGAVKHQKYFSEVNLYSGPLPTIDQLVCNTMPSKLRSPKKQSPDSVQDESPNLKPCVTLSVETQTCPTRDPSEPKTDPSQLVELDRLKEELSKARETISRLKEEKGSEEKASAASPPPEEPKKLVHKAISSEQDFHPYQFTYDLIHLYNNLNFKFRAEAFEALDLANSDSQNVYEFKIKLLFSVIVLAYRYVKTYVRDLKRRIKNLLQIQERSASLERCSSTEKSQTPTIVIQRPEDLPLSSNGDDAASKPPVGSQKRPSLANVGRCNNVRFNSIENEQQSCIRSVENALENYFRACALSNSFDLNKITEEVKQQLWTTLSEYPQLKQCQELSCFISESVKTSWALVNHQPAFRIDYSSSRFNANMHERSDGSSSQNEQILNYVWPALIDTSDNSCLSKGVVIT